jgi:U6 snRNA-associated Sm-like protein LSm2
MRDGYRAKEPKLIFRTPQSSTKNLFVRGSVVRYVHLPGSAVDTALLEDASRREAAAAKEAKEKKSG